MTRNILITTLCLVALVMFVGDQSAPAQDKEKPKFAAIHMTTYDTEDPIEVGKGTVYIVEITNKGTKAATNVDLEVRVPDKLAFGGVATSKGRIESLKFATIDKLAPDEKFTFKVMCVAVAEGSAKFTTTLNYAEFDKPITDQEGTSIYK